MEHIKTYKRELYNYLGDRLKDGEMFVPSDPKYFDDTGMPKWEEFIEHGDAWGFDTRYKCATGFYIERIVLPVGKKVVRYGMDRGSFTTDEDELYDGLSLPYLKKSMPYHEYIVVGECEVACYVDFGIVAPGFGSKGGAVQYRHYYRISESIARGILKEDYAWLQKTV